MPDSLSQQEVYTVFIASRETLHRFFTRYLGCPEIASDLVQDLYLRLDRVPSVSDHEQARAWLFRVATNLARDNAKLRRRRDGLLKTARIGGTEYATPTPEDVALGYEQIRALQAALAELPDRCAEILCLSRVEGLTHGQIAKQLGISKSPSGQPQGLPLQPSTPSRKPCRGAPCGCPDTLANCGIHAPHSL